VGNSRGRAHPSPLDSEWPGMPDANVRFGSLADLSARMWSVRFTPKTDMRRACSKSPLCATSRHWEKHPGLSWSELKLGVGKHRPRHNRRLTNRCPRAGIQSPRQATTLTIDLGVQVCGAFRRYSVTVVAFLVGLVLPGEDARSERGPAPWSSLFAVHRPLAS
jgi:hypothetical protein